MIKPFGDGRDWFFRKRFGMFIHWGLYAIPASWCRPNRSSCRAWG